MGQGARSRASSNWWGQRTPRNWRLQVYTCFLVMSVLCQSCVQCCGPGRGGGRRRSPRKLTPLVFKQHVPNVSENTLGASGLTEGPITRSDPRFHDLVPNYNSDIIFRDEEGTGADRLMTERCQEKLNTLAISVMNQWPGVRVRVIEGWEEEFDHAPHSLHYEGRAVDITTSDKDRAKYGMLARLAREAGFDWVYYESRSHIHCSVKSESSVASKLGGCFPGSGSVMTPSGPRPVSTLKEGDQVQVMKSDGTLAFSPVLMFLHRDPQASRLFLQLRTSKGKILTLTSSHLVFVLPRNDAANKTPSLADALTSGGAALAARIEEGDFLLVRQEGGDVALEEVLEVTKKTGSGVFAPLTSEGTVVVDGVVASCYAVIDSQKIAHWAFFPVRFYNSLKETILSILRKVGAITMPIKRKTEDMVNSNSMQNLTHTGIIWKEGSSVDSNEVNLGKTIEKNVHIHWYARFLYTIASWLLPAHLVYS